MTDSALEIYQAHLDHVTDAFWRGDWDEVCNHMLVPGIYQAPDRWQEIRTPEELIATFKEQRRSLTRMGATSFHRICDEATFVNDDRIEGSHVSHALRSGTYASDPFRSWMPLIWHAGLWKANGIRTEKTNASYTALGPELLAVRTRNAALEASFLTPAPAPETATPAHQDTSSQGGSK